MPGFQSTRLATEGALEPFFFLYTDDSIQGNPETCKQSSIMLNYEVKNNQISAVMLDTLLMPLPIIIKCQIMVMDNDPHVILQRRPFDPFVPLLFPADIQCHVFGRRCQHKYLGPTPIHTCIGEICIHHRGSHQPADDLFFSVPVFAENSSHRPFIIPSDKVISRLSVPRSVSGSFHGKHYTHFPEGMPML